MTSKFSTTETKLILVSKPVKFFSGSFESLKAIVQEHELIRALVGRELKARYKDSFLGIFWSLMRPLVQLLIYYIAIGKFLGAARSVPDFAIFIFTGLTIWGFFSEIVTRGTTSIVHNSGLVKKVYVPREIFPLAVTGGALVNMAIQFAILISATLVFAAPPLLAGAGAGLLSILLILVFGLACSILLSALTVYFRDLEHLVEIAMLILFWASPIVYSYSFVHNALQGNIWETIYSWNPLTLSVIGFQKAMWSAGTEDTGQYWPPQLESQLCIALLFSLVFLFISQRVFEKLQGNFAQEL